VTSLAHRAAGRPVAAAAGVGALLGLVAATAATAPADWRPVIVLAALVPVVATLVADVRRLLLAVVILDVPLQIDRFLAYRDSAASLGAFGGISLSLTSGAIACLWVMRLVSGERAPRESRPVIRRTAVPLALVVAAALLSVTVASDASLSLFEAGMLVQSLLVFLYVASALRTRDDVVFATTMVVLGLFLEGLVALAFLAGAPEVSLGGFDTRLDTQGGLSRFGGTVGSPNNAAAYFGLVVVPALALLIAPVGRGRRVLAGAALAVGAVGLVYTFGRGGWLAVAVGLALFALIAAARGWTETRRVPAALAALVLAAALAGGPVADRLTAEDGGAAGSRVPLARTAISIAADNPLLGVGINNYTLASPPYRTRDIAYTWDYTVHDKYLLVASETGLAGLAPFVWFLVATLRLGLTASRSADPVLRLLALGFTCAIAGHMVHMLVEVLNGRGAVQGLWLSAGIVTAMAVVAARAQEDRDGGRAA
jgi:O-antigen ligase